MLKITKYCFLYMFCYKKFKVLFFLVFSVDFDQYVCECLFFQGVAFYLCCVINVGKTIWFCVFIKSR